MAAKARPWLIGCAVGCGLLVLLAGVIVGVGAFFLRDMVCRSTDSLVCPYIGQIQAFPGIILDLAG